MVRMLRSALSKGKPEWDSFRLTIGSRALKRATAGSPTVEILRTEVTAIFEQPDGLRVTTADRHRAILVPRQLGEFLDARELLSTWRALQEPKLARERLQGFAWGGLLLGLLLATLLIRNLLWAMLAGAVLIIVAWSLIREVRKEQSLSEARKAKLTRLIARFMLAPLLRLAIHFLQQASWLQ